MFQAGATSVNAVQVNHVLGKMAERDEISARDIGMIKRGIYEKARGNKVTIDNIKTGVEQYRKPIYEPLINQ